jgi:hypothetical protein
MRASVSGWSRRRLPSSGPPASAHAGIRFDESRVDEAVYAYWSTVTCKPPRRASRTMSSVFSLSPHILLLPTLKCEISTGIPVSRPTWMASRMASYTLPSSLRMCEAYTPPCLAAAFARATTSSVSAYVPGT